ncbi:MAG: hypothetical protein R6T96_09190 [Longimicrobiales bacterium]
MFLPETPRGRLPELLSRPAILLLSLFLLFGCGDSPTEPITPRVMEVAFISARDGTTSIHAIRSDGTGLRRITDGSRSENWYAWSPDGSKLAVEWSSPGEGWDPWVMNADGTDPLRLTRTPDILESWMQWSPDGSRLAFSADNETGGHDIYTVTVDGDAATNLTKQGPHQNGGPKWSPDGSRIAFVSLRDGNAEIYLMNPDGSGQTNITQTPDFDEGHLDWSPDGTRLTFVNSAKSGGNRDVFVMNLDGTGRRNLSQSPETEDLHPAWSPDGSRIAWDKYDEQFTGSLYVVNSDGSGLLELAPVGTGPAWSPDGSLIAFTGVGTVEGRQYAEVFLVAPDGTGLRILVTPDDPSGSHISSERPWRVVE